MNDQVLSNEINQLTEEQQKFPQCFTKSCPFCGCMSDHTCRIHNVMENAPWLISENADKIDYCVRPKIYSEKLKEEVIE